MIYLKYLYIDDNIKLIIEEDIVGFYLIVFKNPISQKSNEDYLVDSLDDAFKEAKDRFGILRNQWKLIQE